MKFREAVQVGSLYFAEKLPKSPVAHRGLEDGDVIEVSAVGSSWCDVTLSSGKTFRLFSGHLRAGGLEKMSSRQRTIDEESVGPLARIYGENTPSHE